jgi:hypothetical protein
MNSSNRNFRCFNCGRQSPMNLQAQIPLLNKLVFLVVFQSWPGRRCKACTKPNWYLIVFALVALLALGAEFWGIL